MNISSIFNKSNYMAFFKTAKDTNLSTLIYRTMTTIRDAIQYPRWFDKQILSEELLEQQRNTVFSYEPLISIVVPTYCTPIPFLHELLNSILAQTYSNWELCIADASPADSEIRPLLTQYQENDTRIKITFLESNKGISGNTNYALQLSTGEFIGLLDHDDILAPNALYEIVSALNSNPSIDVIYTDEDKIDGEANIHYYPNFKPDYNRLLLQSCNYICHFFVFKRSIYNQVGTFDASYDGSQDYHYILRATTVAKCVHHIPKMLYHWRVHRGSVAGNPTQKQYCYAAAKQALQEYITSLDINGKIDYSRLIGFYKTQYQVPKDSSVLICSFSQKLVIEKHPNYQLQIVYLTTLDELLNTLNEATTDYCIVLSENILSFSRENIEQTISYFQLKDVGATAYKLTFHNKVISLGMTYRNQKISGCYSSVPHYDAGFYGRALLDQYVPFCSPFAFACRLTDIKQFLKQYTVNTEPITVWDELVIAFSLYLYANNKKIAGTAQVELACKKKTPIYISKEFIQKNKEELQQAAKLYCVPPYY